MFKQKESNPLAQKKSHAFVVKDRLHLDAPSHSLILGEPSPIEVSKATAGLMTLIGEQEVVHGNDDKRKDKVAGSDATYTMYTSNGKHYINITPMHLGKIDLEVFSTYADGGIAADRITVDVVPPAKTPIRLIVGDSGRQNVSSIFEEFPAKQGMHTKHRIFVAAMYKGLKQPIDIPWELTKYHTRQSGQTPVIRVDGKSGEITTLRQGHSLLELSYGGLKHLTCIVVKAPGPENADHSGCRDLLLAGESLGEDVVEATAVE